MGAVLRLRGNKEIPTIEPDLDNASVGRSEYTTVAYSVQQFFCLHLLTF